jgi:hypothetical protein
MWLLFGFVPLFDGVEKTRDNAAGALLRIFEDGGLEQAAETGRLPTGFGSLAFYRARKGQSDNAAGRSHGSWIAPGRHAT